MRKAEFIFHTLLFGVLLSLLAFMGKGAIIFILVAQFFLGIFQVINSLIRTFRISTFNTKMQQTIRIYWILCLLYGAGWLIILIAGIDRDIAFIYLLCAWMIALYYYAITYELAFPKYTRSHLDI